MSFPPNFVRMLVEGQTTPFRAHFARLFSFAQHEAKFDDNFRKSKCVTLKKKGNASPHIRLFMDWAATFVEAMAECFHRFDFRSMADLMATRMPNGLPSEHHVSFQLWNAIHLFFIRGLRMEPAFPPLLKMTTTDVWKTLDYVGPLADVAKDS